MAEVYYLKIARVPAVRDCGSGAHGLRGRHETAEDPVDRTGVGALEADLIRQEVARAVAAGLEAGAAVPNGWRVGRRRFSTPRSTGDANSQRRSGPDWTWSPGAWITATAAGDGTGHSDLPNVDEEAVRVRSAVAGFLKSRPMLLFDMPAEIATTGRAWPSPRTWDMATVLWAAANRANAPDEVAMTLIAGCIGPGPARELLAWQREADLPDPEAVLDDPSSFKLPDRGDRQFAVLNAVSAAVAARPTRERWEAAFQIVEQAVQLGASDVAAVAARALAKCVPPDVPALPPTLTALAPVLDRAGLLHRRR
jgi:hypothetical protein